jgi:hypothetical protein
MTWRMTRWFAGVLVVCWTAEPAAGRLIDPWSYERLFKEADLIVVAAPVGEEKADDAFGRNPWDLDIVGLNTAFEVKHTLKGKPDGKQIKLLHFRFVEPPKNKFVIIEDGPGFVAFRREAALVGDGDRKAVLPTPEYLLFLRRLKDGRYEPVSGKVDPRFAVREMSEPLERALGGGK